MLNSFLALAATPLLLQAQHNVTCRAADYIQAEVSVNVIEKPVSVNHGMSVDEMQLKYRSELFERQKKLKANYFLHDTDHEIMARQLSGVTKADLLFDTDIGFVSMPQNPAQSMHCILYKNVTVTVTFQTIMTIAGDLPKGGCVYEAVKDYQMKYHEANAKVVHAVADQMRADLPELLPHLEQSMVPSLVVGDKYREMTQGVEQAVDKYRQDMDSLMQEYRSHIDTPEALKELAESCKGVEEDFDALQPAAAFDSEEITPEIQSDVKTEAVESVRPKKEMVFQTIE